MKRDELVNPTSTYSYSSDLTKDYMPRDCQSYPYNTEVTVTFDQKRHTKASAYLAEKTIVNQLWSWFKEVREMIVVIEYQKNGFPHYHINIGHLENDIAQNFNTMRAFERFYGYTTVKAVMDCTKWEDYLFKDVEKNNALVPTCEHYKVYFAL